MLDLFDRSVCRSVSRANQYVKLVYCDWRYFGALFGLNAAF